MSERAERHAFARAHEAIGFLLDEGELPIAWALVVDVVGTDGRRTLAHRAGGGADGWDTPPVWQVLGMLEAGVHCAVDDLIDARLGDELDDDDE